MGLLLQVFGAKITIVLDISKYSDGFLHKSAHYFISLHAERKSYLSITHYYHYYVHDEDSTTPISYTDSDAIVIVANH